MTIPFSQLKLYLKIIWLHVIFYLAAFISDESYYLQLGLAYYYLGKFRKAIKLFERSEEAHNHRNADYTKCNYVHLGSCYFYLGDFVKATGYFERCLKFKEDPQLLEDLSYCYQMINRPLDALETLLRGEQLEPEAPDWNTRCARILMELGRKDESLKHLKLAEMKEKDANERKIMDTFENRLQGRFDKAIEVIKDVISNLDASSTTSVLERKSNLYAILSEWQSDISDREGALNSLERAFENNPADLWVTNSLAMEYANQGINLDKALMLTNDCLKYQPDNSIFIDTRGWILFKMGKREEAKAEIERSLALNPECKETNEHYKLMLT
jgi:tetratricopeptide (TPR) repeat protein